MFKPNAASMSDYYKFSHPKQYPPGTEIVYSNTTPRSSRLQDVNEVVVFGTQFLIQEYFIDNWRETFFSLPKDAAVYKLKRLMDFTLGKDSVDVSLYGELWDIGYLPLRVKALPEGTLCPIGVPFMTIVNTLPQFYWLTNFVETLTQTVLWQAIVSATIAREYKKLLTNFANKTSDATDFVKWQGHDFSMRGMSSVETGYVSGGGHLLSFTGTDTVTAIEFLENFYGADVENELVGASVPATEHAVMCAGGEEDEVETFRRLIEDVYPSGIVSIVSDTWDFWSVLTNILPSLKSKIMSRDGKVVVRPDCYDDKTEILTNSGWKFFSQLTDSDYVAQVLDDGSREFVKPVKIVDQHYKGEMCHFTDSKGKVDLLVTPNHRMVLLYNGKEKIIEASKLKDTGNSNQKMIRSASSPSGVDRLSNIDRIRIAFQADGSFQTNCNSNKIRFSFSKQRKIDRLKQLLDAENIEYSVYPLKDGRVEFNITLDVYDFSKDFEWVKYSSTKEWCQEFIEEVSYWDATRRSDNRFKFDTTNKSVADKVDFIAISAGYGSLSSHRQDNRSDKFSDVYTLHIMKNNTVGGGSWVKQNVEYDGRIYCVTVPTGKVLVRRNRCTMVCGNSGDPVKIITGYLVKNVNITKAQVLRKISNMKSFAAMFDGNDCVLTSDGQYITVEGKTITKPEADGAIQVIYNYFGGTLNSKGYIDLDPHIGLIYGDSITLSRCKTICERLELKGFSTTNVVFGIGSYTYQYNTRDTFSIACKATWVQINGEPKSIFKNPKTDSGTKKSAKGLLTVMKEDGRLVLKDNCTPEEESGGELKIVFENGAAYNKTTLSEIRNRLL